MCEDSTSFEFLSVRSSILIDTQYFSKIFSIGEDWISFFQINGIENEFMKFSRFIWMFFDILKLNEWMKIY